MWAAVEMTFLVEMVVDGTADRNEFLKRFRISKFRQLVLVAGRADARFRPGCRAIAPSPDGSRYGSLITVRSARRPHRAHAILEAEGPRALRPACRGDRTLGRAPRIRDNHSAPVQTVVLSEPLLERIREPVDLGFP